MCDDEIEFVIMDSYIKNKFKSYLTCVKKAAK